MWLYVALVLFLAIISVLSIENWLINSGNSITAKKVLLTFGQKRLYSRILVLAILFLLWFLTAFRSADIGNDTQTYIDLFYRIQRDGISDSLRLEHGYQALCVVIGWFTDDAQWLLIICATICYGGLGIYIFKYSKNELISIAIAFCICFSIFTSMLRQNIAMVICLFAYQLIKNRKNIVALLLIILACTFHKSAAIMVLIVFHKFLRLKLPVVVILSIILALLGMSGLVNGLVEMFAVEYSHYFNGKYAHSGWLAVSVDVFRALVFYLFVYKVYGNNRKENSVVLANFALVLLICCLGYTVNLFTRAAEYFMLPAIVEIPNAFATKKIKDGKLWLAVTVIIMLLYFIVTLVLRPEWNNLYPYTFFWG